MVKSNLVWLGRHLRVRVTCKKMSDNSMTNLCNMCMYVHAHAHCCCFSEIISGLILNDTRYKLYIPRS